MRPSALLLALGLATAVAAATDELPLQVMEALRLATEYATGTAAVEGGYPAVLDPATGRRQATDGAPLGPGAVDVAATAALGLACLDAHRVTSEALYRDAALAAARALARGQLASGGWGAVLDPAAGEYTRAHRLAGEAAAGRPERMLLAGGLTPAALRLLVETAAATTDEPLHEAAGYGLRALLNAQLASGGWPAEVPLPGGPGRLPEVTGTAAVVELLLVAGPPCEAAARRGGDWLLTAWRATPPGWAAAEPDQATTIAAVTALLRLQEATAEARYLDPVRALLPWLEAQSGQTELAAWARRRVRQPTALARPPTRDERAQRTAARAPRVVSLLAALDDQGRWLDDGRWTAATLVARLRELTAWLREYEPLPDWPAGPDGRPAQHRRM